jgi:hypothetical protein
MRTVFLDGSATGPGSPLVGLDAERSSTYRISQSIVLIAQSYNLKNGLHRR